MEKRAAQLPFFNIFHNFDTPSIFALRPMHRARGGGGKDPWE